MLRSAKIWTLKGPGAHNPIWVRHCMHFGQRRHHDPPLQDTGPIVTTVIRFGDGGSECAYCWIQKIRLRRIFTASEKSWTFLQVLHASSPTLRNIRYHQFGALTKTSHWFSMSSLARFLRSRQLRFQSGGSSQWFRYMSPFHVVCRHGRSDKLINVGVPSCGVARSRLQMAGSARSNKIFVRQLAAECWWVWGQNLCFCLTRFDVLLRLKKYSSKIILNEMSQVDQIYTK